LIKNAVGKIFDNKEIRENQNNLRRERHHYEARRVKFLVLPIL